MGLNATFRIVGPDGEKRIKAEDMFLSAYTTAMGDQDILASIDVPKLSVGAQTGYYKIIRKVGEYPMTTATVVRDKDKGFCNVVMAASTLTQKRLPKTSICVENLLCWSDSSAAAVKSAYQEDMADMGRSDDSYVLKLCETTIIRAARAALEKS